MSKVVPVHTRWVILQSHWLKLYNDDVICDTHRIKKAYLKKLIRIYNNTGDVLNPSERM